MKFSYLFAKYIYLLKSYVFQVRYDSLKTYCKPAAKTTLLFVRVFKLKMHYDFCEIILCASLRPFKGSFSQVSSYLFSFLL